MTSPSVVVAPNWRWAFSIPSFIICFVTMPQCLVQFQVLFMMVVFTTLFKASFQHTVCVPLVFSLIQGFHVLPHGLPFLFLISLSANHRYRLCCFISFHCWVFLCDRLLSFHLFSTLLTFYWLSGIFLPFAILNFRISISPIVPLSTRMTGNKKVCYQKVGRQRLLLNQISLDCPNVVTHTRKVKMKAWEN